MGSGTIGHDDFSLSVVWFDNLTDIEKAILYVNVSGTWTSDESVESSTWRELEAVRRVMFSFENSLRGTCTTVYTDNANVKYVINSGSKVPKLNSIVIDIDSFYDQNNIILNVEWIPRQQNQRII